MSSIFFFEACHTSVTVVSFAFAALSYADPRRNQYAYKIDGLNDDWIQIGSRHEVTVSNLRPGSYVFRVKGSNHHSVWNEQGAASAGNFLKSLKWT